MTQLIGGYKADSSVDFLQFDPILQTLSHNNKLASQPTILRQFY